jgi:hypothetical protein
MTIAVDYQFRRVDLWVERPKCGNLIDRDHALGCRETLGAVLSFLGREQTEPDLTNIFLERPRVNEFLQVARLRKELRDDGAVNDDPVTADVPQDALIGGWSPPRIVFGPKTINRNNQVQIGQFSPFLRDGANGAGDDLDLYLHDIKLPDETGQFSKANQRFTADEGDMQRTIPSNQFENSLDQFLTLQIAQSAEGVSVVQVARFIGVAARASERAFFCDFNG